MRAQRTMRWDRRNAAGRAVTLGFAGSGGLAVVALLAIMIVSGCQRGGGEITRLDAKTLADGRIPAAYVDADGSNETLVRDTVRNPYPYLKFGDGRVSLNNKCPVRKVGLNVKLPGLFVNGRPIGFC